MIFSLNNHFYTCKSLNLSCQQPPILSELILENAYVSLYKLSLLIHHTCNVTLYTFTQSKS